MIRPAAKSPVALSFINLIEAHVLAAIRRKHRIDMPAVRRTIEFLKREFGSPHPLADYKFETNGVDLFVEHLGDLISVSQGGQLAIRQLLEAHLRRIDRDDKGFPLRLYPFTRVNETEQPKNIVIDRFLTSIKPHLPRRFAREDFRSSADAFVHKRSRHPAAYRKTVAQPGHDVCAGDAE